MTEYMNIIRLHTVDDMILVRRRKRIYAFIDESGKPEQLKGTPFVLVAVTLFEEHVNYSKEETREFLNRYKKLFKTKFKIDFKEMHIREIVNGEGEWRKVDFQERNSFIMAAARKLSKLPLYLNIVVTKAGNSNTLIRRPRGIRRHAFRLLIERILYTTPIKLDELLIAYDSISINEDKKIEIDLIEASRGSYAKFKGDIYMRFPRSEEEELIQWADFVAYIVSNIERKRYQIKGIDLQSAFKTIENKIRRCPSGGSTYEGCGLKRWII